MLGAIPGTASESSLNRRGAPSRASTRSRLQRSPTRSRAAPSALGGGGAPAGVGGGIRVMVGEGLARPFDAVVDCKSQVTPSRHARTSEAPAPMSVLTELQEAVAAV